MYCSQCGTESSGNFCVKCGAATADSGAETKKSNSRQTKKKGILIASALALVGLTAVGATLTFMLPNSSANKVSLDGLSGGKILNILISDGFCPKDAAGQNEGDEQMCMADEDHAIAIFAGMTEADIAATKSDSLNYLYGKDWIILYQDKAIADLAENYESNLVINR